MIEVVVTAFDKVISALEAFKKNKELKEAVREQIIAELHFNSEVLDEICKYHSSRDNSKQQQIPSLTGILDTGVFDSLQQSCIPLSYLFEGERVNYPQADKFWKSAENKDGNKNFYAWSKNLMSHSELISHIYHRLKIARALNSIEINKTIVSIRYLKWLIIYHKQYLKKQ